MRMLRTIVDNLLRHYVAMRDGYRESQNSCIVGQNETNLYNNF